MQRGREEGENRRALAELRQQDFRGRIAVRRDARALLRAPEGVTLVYGVVMAVQLAADVKL